MKLAVETFLPRLRPANCNIAPPVQRLLGEQRGISLIHDTAIEDHHDDLRLRGQTRMVFDGRIPFIGG